MIDQKFNVSASRDERLRHAQEHRERIEKIERLADLGRREQLYEQIKINEQKMLEEKAKAKQIEEAAVQDSIKRNVAAKHGLHLRPNFGQPLTPRKQETQIRKNIRRSLGAKLDRQLNQIRLSLDRDLDNAISRAHSISQTTLTETQHSQDQKDTRSRTRTTGRTRTRRR